MKKNSRTEIEKFLKISSNITINTLISALENKEITLSSPIFKLTEELDDDDVGESVKEIFKKLESNGETIDGVIVAFKLLNEIKNMQNQIKNSTRLVCTIPPPDVLIDESDRTDLKIIELVSKAKKSITIIGYLMTDDDEIRTIFQNILANPEIENLHLKFIFNRPKEKQELGKEYPSIKETIRTLWNKESEALDKKITNFPEIYGYREKKSSLHAKVIIIDSNEILVTSANLSGRGQERNFEMGLCHVGICAKDAEDLIGKKIDDGFFSKI